MEAMKAMEVRQSCRSYTPEQIGEADLELILKAANAAPVGMGRYENVHLTVIQNEELLNEIDGVAAEFFGDPEKHPLYGARTLILVSAILPEAPRTTLAYCNAGCIVENMALAATDLGLGNVYIFGSVNALNLHPELVAKLNLPTDFVPVSALAVGKAATPMKGRTFNKKIETDYIR
ncbi:MAG: nitroreductase family protein [Oscillospiraceae bacterium]